MTNTKHLRPISYLKTSAADVIKELAENETNALVEIVRMGEREIQLGKHAPLAKAKANLDERIFGKTD